MPSIDSQSLNLRMLSTIDGKEEMQLDDPGFDDQSLSEYDSQYSYGFLSTIWEETSMDLNSTAGCHSVSGPLDADSPPCHPRRARSLSPGVRRGRSLSPEYDPATNEWMANLLSTSESGPQLQLVLDDTLEDSSSEDSLEDYLDKQRKGTSLDRTSHHNVTLINLATGEKKKASESDDDFTFVSCTTDCSSMHSLNTDIDESFRSSTVTTDIDESFRSSLIDASFRSGCSNLSDDGGSPFMTSDGEQTTKQQSEPVGKQEDREGKQTAESLQTIPEGDSDFVSESARPAKDSLDSRRCSDDMKALDPLTRKRNFAMNRKSVEMALATVQNSLPRPEEAALMKLSRSGSNSNLFSNSPGEKPPKREKDLKMKFRLERFGGQRRQLNYQRSKNKLMKKLDLLGSRARGIGGEKPSKEALEKFGGLRRSKSFKESKMLFQNSLNKTSNELLSPRPRRRRSLSPPPGNRRNGLASELMNSFSKSDSNLDFTKYDLTEEKEVDTSRQAVMKRRHRLERYSGQRRRNTFERSRKALTKSMKLSRRGGLDGASMQEVERFGGLHRSESYRKSRAMFQESFSKNRALQVK